MFTWKNTQNVSIFIIEVLINTRFPSFKGQNEKYFEESKKARTKYLYKTVHIDLIKSST